jgi:hypothetical protein
LQLQRPGEGASNRYSLHQHKSSSAAAANDAGLAAAATAALLLLLLLSPCATHRLR